MRKALQLTGGEQILEIVTFVDTIDKLFYVLNVQNYTHGRHSREE